jgi:hypothetical protein
VAAAYLFIVRPKDMPLGPKLVLAIQMIGLVLSVFGAFARLNVGASLGIVIQSAILLGLYTRQTVAWMTARWLAALGATFMSVLLVLITIGGTTKPWLWALFASETALAWFFFSLLGRPDSRAYFHAPRRA